MVVVYFQFKFKEQTLILHRFTQISIYTKDYDNKW